MGLFDDLLIAESDEYICIFSYVEYLATEYDSSVIATISYLLKSNIQNIYYYGRGGVYQKDDEPKAVELALRGLLNNLNKKISNVICNGDQQSELELFISMWDDESYGLFKTTELPIISVPKDYNNEVSSNEQQPSPAHLNSITQQLADAHAQIADKPAPVQGNATSHLNDHTEKSYQTTIGLLLELMTTPKGIDGKAPFQSQATIIGDILDKDIQGQRKTTLENRFRDANLMLADAKKKRPKSN